MGIGFKPLGARLVIERMEHEQKTPGGIIIPDTAKEKPTQGKVMAVGPGRRLDDGKLIPLDAKVGDVVLFSKWGGSEINIRNKEYIIVKEEDILGIIE
jgi:chaperonin GroES